MSKINRRQVMMPVLQTGGQLPGDLALPDGAKGLIILAFDENPCA